MTRSCARGGVDCRERKVVRREVGLPNDLPHADTKLVQGVKCICCSLLFEMKTALPALVGIMSNVPCSFM